jgi:hypothetical protein
MFLVGGYMPALKSFMRNTFTLDEHRSLLVAMQHMETARADHAMMLAKGIIYVFGGETML